MRLNNKDTGCYVLVVCVELPCWIKAGKLSEREFEKGLYLYIGRAKRNLRGRLARHLRAEKKLFWHIDYLLQQAFIEKIWCRLAYFDECRIFSSILKVCGKTCLAIPGFGASDCRCPSHLIQYSGERSFLACSLNSIHLREVPIDDIDNNPI